MALAKIAQTDFSAGMCRTRVALPNAVYDAVNLLLDDQGRLFKRGGSTLKSSSDATNTLTLLWDGQMTPGRRTVFVSDRLYILDTDDAAPLLITSVGTANLGPPVEVNGWLVFPSIASSTVMSVVTYGGSRKNGLYSTGTVTVTNGSTAVTGVGTAWLANIDAGVQFNQGASTQWGIVSDVTSDTSLTLRDPWPYATAAGSAYLAYQRAASQTIATVPPATTGTVVGSAARRLLLGRGSKVYFSAIGLPLDMATDTNYHVIPNGATVNGIVGLGDTALVFSSSGVWLIGNLSLAPVDDFGNIQHTVQRASDILLWGNAGIAPWQGGVVVPATDNVYVMQANGSAEPIAAAFKGAGIGPLYRSYVAAGYQPGIAAVHRGHYLLAILNGTTVVDVLACRLDRPYLLSTRPRIWGYPWTRLSGHAAGVAYAQRAVPNTPKLLGLNGLRVTDVSGIFDPTASNSQDADGSNVTVTAITNDIQTGGDQPGTVMRTRAFYEFTSDGTHAAPTVALAFSSDQDADVYTTPTDSGLQGGGTAGAVSDGSKYSWWRVVKKRGRIRFKVATSGAAGTFVLRSIEALIRQTGRQ